MDTRPVAVEFVGPERAVERARFQVRGRADFHHRPEVPPEAHTHRLPLQKPHSPSVLDIR